MFDKKIIEELKRRVPSIPDIVIMGKESANSYSGPCPKCGGKDRFVYKTDSRKAFCRHCHEKAMDNLDFQKWRYGKSIKDLIEEYMPEYNLNQVQNPGAVKPLKESPVKKSQEQTEQGKNPEMKESWENIQEKHKNRTPVQDLFFRRGFPKEFADKIFEEGLVRSVYHAKESSVAFTFKTLQGDDVLAIQYQTVSGQTYSFTEKYSKAANKVLKKGSKLGADCFFVCGTKPEDAKEAFVYESIVNALTGYFCLPDACHVAIGSTSCIKKLKALKPYKHIKKFVLCFDNDAAGEVATKKAAGILGVRSYAVQWPKCYRLGLDINDKLKAGDIKGIMDSLTNVVRVGVDKADKKKQPQLPHQETESDLPLFVDGEEQLRVDTRLAWGIVVDENDPPEVFEHSTGVVIVKSKPKPSEKRNIEQMTPNRMRCRLAKVADWVREKETKDGPVRVAVPPFKSVCENMLEDISPSLPFLKGIITAPTLTEEGVLHKDPGYSEKSKYILELSPGLIIPDIPETPTTDEKAQARECIYELLEGFPFTSPAERAHAITLLIHPFVRAMIPGMVPMLIIEASTPGTGKTLLVKVLTYIFLGQDVQTMTIGKNDEETRKKITAKAINTPAYLFLDNVKDKIDSATIAAFITSGNWEDRLLGQTKMVSIPVTCALVATGNNITMSSEIARRSIRSKQDARLDRPWERTGEEYFKHPDLMGWTKKHRGKLIGAVLTLVQAWISAGRPVAEGKRLGGFEEWSDVMGGILSVAGISGFLENLNDFYEDSDAEGSVLRSLISAWYRTFGGAEIGVSDIFHIVIKNEIPVDIGEKSERSQKTKLGQLLRQLKGRRFTIETETEDGGKENSSFQVTAGKISHSAQQWKLTYKPMVPNKNIEKGEPQNIGSPISSPLKLVDFTGKGERGEPGEPKLNPIRAHIHTRTCARTQENCMEGGKGSPGSPRSQNLISLDSYKGEPMGELQEIGSPFMNDNNDEVII